MTSINQLSAEIYSDLVCTADKTSKQFVEFANQIIKESANEAYNEQEKAFIQSIERFRPTWGIYNDPDLDREKKRVSQKKAYDRLLGYQAAYRYILRHHDKCTFEEFVQIARKNNISDPAEQKIIFCAGMFDIRKLEHVIAENEDISLY